MPSEQVSLALKLGWDHLYTNEEGRLVGLPPTALRLDYCYVEDVEELKKQLEEKSKCH